VGCRGDPERESEVDPKRFQRDGEGKGCDKQESLERQRQEVEV
jgi:hypothetical protein